jgi:hypothetical protein
LVAVLTLTLCVFILLFLLSGDLSISGEFLAAKGKGATSQGGRRAETKSFCGDAKSFGGVHFTLRMTN